MSIVCDSSQLPSGARLVLAKISTLLLNSVHEKVHVVAQSVTNYYKCNEFIHEMFRELPQIYRKITISNLIKEIYPTRSVLDNNHPTR